MSLLEELRRAAPVARPWDWVAVRNLWRLWFAADVPALRRLRKLVHLQGGEDCLRSEWVVNGRGERFPPVIVGRPTIFVFGYQRRL
jgi:hypothetical protein